MTTSITAARIKAAEPGTTLHDDKMPGLQLRIFEKRRVWYFRYTARSGRQRRPKLGDWPAFSVEDARRVARKMREQIVVGKDPAETWETQRNSPTVADLADRYLKEWAPREKKARSVREDARQTATYIKPRLGRMLVADVQLEDIEAFLDDVRDGKLPGQKGGPAPIAANRVRALLSKMFALAETRFKMRPQHTNPVRGTRMNTERARRRHLTAVEFPVFRKALDELSASYPAQVAAILTILYTGARVSEIAYARHEQLEGDRVWLQEHKTSEHIGDKAIAIPEAAQALMRRYVVTSSPYIFGGHSLRHVWDKAREAAGVPDLQLRDLRRSFASVALSNGVSLDEVGKLFGHKSTATTARYSWMMKDRSNAVTEQTVAAMETLMEGE